MAGDDIQRPDVDLRFAFSVERVKVPRGIPPERLDGDPENWLMVGMASLLECGSPLCQRSIHGRRLPGYRDQYLHEAGPLCAGCGPACREALHLRSVSVVSN